MSRESELWLTLEHTGVWTLHADGELLEALHGSSEADPAEVCAWASAVVRDAYQASVEYWSPEHAAGGWPVYGAIATVLATDSDGRAVRRAAYLVDLDGQDRPD